MATLAASAPTKGTNAKLRSNARAVAEYAKTSWSRTKVEVLPNTDLELKYGNVLVTAFPDLTFKANGRTKVLKFDFRHVGVEV